MFRIIPETCHPQEKHHLQVNTTVSFPKTQSFASVFILLEKWEVFNRKKRFFVFINTKKFRQKCAMIYS